MCTSTIHSTGGGRAGGFGGGIIPTSVGKGGSGGGGRAGVGGSGSGSGKTLWKDGGFGSDGGGKTLWKDGAFGRRLAGDGFRNGGGGPNDGCLVNRRSLSMDVGGADVGRRGGGMGGGMGSGMGGGMDGGMGSGMGGGLDNGNGTDFFPFSFLPRPFPFVPFLAPNDFPNTFKCFDCLTACACSSCSSCNNACCSSVDMVCINCTFFFCSCSFSNFFVCCMLLKKFLSF